MNLEKDIKGRKIVAIKAAKEAGKMLCNNFGKVLKIQTKSDRSLVSNIDLKAEKIIVQLIKKYYPQDDILSEEGQNIFSDSDFTPLEVHTKGVADASGALLLTGFNWIIDPLDGTHNYIRGIDVFGTSIAVEFKKEVVLGVIYMPFLDELYVAQKGKGAYLNNKKIKVSKSKLSETVMIYDSTIRCNKGPMLSSLGSLVDKVFNVRMFGSTVRSLSYVAEGKADVEVEYNDKVWDFAAGLLLVEEAGGKATDLCGKKWNTNSLGYVASNGIIHKDILKMIKKRK